MAYDDDPSKVSGVPYTLTQNPAPSPASGQEFLSDKQELVSAIMNAFRSVLPSNYVAATTGPWYSVQFEAMAEQLAEIQLELGEVFKDSEWDFTRSEFLWQLLGTFVFPAASDLNSDIPQMDGDLAYRTFLKKMVLCLLEGATLSSMAAGLEALDSDVSAIIMERYLESPPRDEDGAYTIIDQFIVDIFMEGTGSTFPADPIQLEKNARLVLGALKPAHVFYTYSYLFRDAFGTIASDTGGLSLDLSQYHYADLRKWCLGAKEISGTGSTLSNRSLFSDPDVSFESVSSGGKLSVLSGANKGTYVVESTRALLFGVDVTPRSYTTSTGGTGQLTAFNSDSVLDPSQDWGQFPTGTTIAISAGPNQGTYRLDTVLGSEGGPVGLVSPTASSNRTKVRVSPSIIKIRKFMLSTLSGQSYEVVVDRLGVQVPRTIVNEDVSLQFVL